MVDNKLIFGLVAVLLVAAVVGVILYQRNNNNKKEGFGMLPSFQTKIDRAVEQTSGPNKGEFVSFPGTYQSMLSPRAFSGSYGAYINYRVPDLQNLAVPEDPLSYGKMVKENFDVDTSNCAQALADVRSSSVASGLARAAIDNGMPDLVDPYPTVSDLLPVGDMTTVNAMGEESQPIVYDRFMYANRNSRLRGRGDMIRGDLAIVPCNFGWFNPSVQPNIDLQAGALNVMGGFDNEQGQKLAALINTTSGGADTTIAGINVGNQFATTLGMGQRDVTVSAYP
jgi:hypothetical protein